MKRNIVPGSLCSLVILAALLTAGCKGASTAASVPLPMGGKIVGMLSSVSKGTQHLTVQAKNGATYHINAQHATVALNGQKAEVAQLSPGASIQVAAIAMDNRTNEIEATRVQVWSGGSARATALPAGSGASPVPGTVQTRNNTAQVGAREPGRRVRTARRRESTTRVALRPRGVRDRDLVTASPTTEAGAPQDGANVISEIRKRPVPADSTEIVRPRSRRLVHQAADVNSPVPETDTIHQAYSPHHYARRSGRPRLGHYRYTPPGSYNPNNYQLAGVGDTSGDADATPEPPAPPDNLDPGSPGTPKQHWKHTRHLRRHTEETGQDDSGSWKDQTKEWKDAEEVVRSEEKHSHGNGQSGSMDRQFKQMERDLKSFRKEPKDQDEEGQMDSGDNS